MQQTTTLDSVRPIIAPLRLLMADFSTVTKQNSSSNHIRQKASHVCQRISMSKLVQAVTCLMIARLSMPFVLRVPQANHQYHLSQANPLHQAACLLSNRVLGQAACPLSNRVNRHNLAVNLLSNQVNHLSLAACHLSTHQLSLAACLLSNRVNRQNPAVNLLSNQVNHLPLCPQSPQVLNQVAVLLTILQFL